MTCSTEIELGAYVLHALEVTEADAVEQHVSGCRTCQHELSSLESTVSWLALLTARDVEQLEELQEPPPDDARPHPRGHRAVLTLVAGLLGVLVVVGGVLALQDRPTTSSPVVRAVDNASHVEAAVSMSRRGSGTGLRLTLTGAYPRGTCLLVARSDDGRTETAATWVADADGTADVAGTTTIATDQLRELDVVTDTGRLLVRIPVPPQTS